ncbi:MAG TPA: Hsp70 family protein [Micromonosporaceae bacterium]|nr:Hsp70 family protein [Micromonosporaceae bacterium]
MPGPARLSVDLGTTHTVAVVRRAGQPARSLLFDGSPLLPSCVHVDAAGTVHTGRDAHRLGQVEPHRFEPYPKRRVDDGAVLLGAEAVPVARLLAATLRRVAGEARQAGVEPGGASVLTCPADWGQPRRQVLRDAASLAGLGEVALVEEPVAAATYCVEVLGHQVPPGAALGVFDFGGGTLDVAVVRREPAGFRVLAVGGLDDLGGLDVDAALVGHLGHLVAARDPALWRRLSQPDGTGALRDRQAFWAEVRSAKEMLSRTAQAPVAVPHREDPLHLTRQELEQVAGPLVARAVDETRRVLQRAGVDPATLAGLLLVGGTSRMPLVASRLHARLGVAAAVPEQPELPVAYGGLLVPAPPAAPAGDSQPRPGRHAQPEPAGGPRPGSAAGPVPAAAPAGGLLLPPPGGPYPAWPPSQHVQQPERQLPAVAPRRPSRRRMAILVAAALVVALVTGGGVQVVRWLGGTWGKALDAAGSGLSGLGGGQAGRVGELRVVHDAALPAGEGAVAVATAGDRAFYAAVGDGHTEVVALPAGGGDPLWRQKVPVEPVRLRLSVVRDLLVLDAEDSATDQGSDVRAVLGANGAVLWRSRWEERRDVLHLGTDAVVESQRPPAVLRVDLRTGRTRWSRSGPDELLINDDWRVAAERAWPGPDAQKGGSPPVAAALVAAMGEDLRATGALVELNEEDGRGYLLDAGTGKPRGSGALPLVYDHWFAYDGLVVGQLSSDVPEAVGRTVVAAYRLPGFSRAWSYRLPAGVSLNRVKPCGPHQVCVASSGTNAGKVVALEAATGKEKWATQVEWSHESGWYVSAGALVFGDMPFESVDEPKVLGVDGTAVRTVAGRASVVALGGGRVLLREAGLNGTRVVWQVSVAEVGADRRTPDVGVGEDLPVAMALSGDVAVVAGADRKVRVLRVSGLSG